LRPVGRCTSVVYVSANEDDNGTPPTVHDLDVLRRTTEQLIEAFAGMAAIQTFAAHTPSGTDQGRALTTTEQPTEIDPLDEYRLQAFGSIQGMEESLRLSDGEDRCEAVDPRGRRCSRRKHHEYWRHVAVSEAGRIRSAWASELFDDPFADITMRSSNVGNSHNSVYGLFSRSSQCEFAMTNGYLCTRPKGHPTTWKHVHYRYGDVYALQEPTEETNAEQKVEVFDDPEDGTPPDTVDLLTTKPPIGTMVRLRDRALIMEVVGHREGAVECFDFSRSKMRVMRLGQLVVTDQRPTNEQFVEMLKWFTANRETTREVAIREYKRGRWCLAGLNENLRNLGLPEYVPPTTGQLMITIPVTLQRQFNQYARNEAVQQLVTQAFSGDRLALLKAAIPDIEGVGVNLDAIRITSGNFQQEALF
jgi:hypothetical protein